MGMGYIAKHWYAYIYEQQETETQDVDFLLNLLQKKFGTRPHKILEVGCGGGRISVPLAKARHIVTGIDKDEHMLLRCYMRSKGLANLNCICKDAVNEDWGTGYDIVVIAGNLLINIETDTDYARAQEAFFHKAARALRLGGHIYIDFDLHYDPAEAFSGLRETSYFEGTDDLGTFGRTVGYGSVYNPVTQICAGAGHIELTTINGGFFTVPSQWHKHIPTQRQVYKWLDDAGFAIVKTFKNYTEASLPDPIDETTHRATIWARKAKKE